jgi:putative transposase
MIEILLPAFRLWPDVPISQTTIARTRLQSDLMLCGLQFSSLIRAGLGICLELSAFVGSFFRSRSSLIAENLLLRKQLAFYQERQIRPSRLTDAARLSLVFWSKLCNWKSALVIVKPETLIGWHRRGFKVFWKLKSRPGRPKLPNNIRQLIARMAEENPTWGQGRVADELALKLGIRVSLRTVGAYWPNLPDSRGPLGDHFKSGQPLSVQNRPTEVAVQD